MGQSRPLFVYFHSFLITISIIQIENSADGVLGIWTQDHRMVGADETTELWRPPPSLWELILGTKTQLSYRMCKSNPKNRYPISKKVDGHRDLFFAFSLCLYDVICVQFNCQKLKIISSIFDRWGEENFYLENFYFRVSFLNPCFHLLCHLCVQILFLPAIKVKWSWDTTISM